MSKVVIHLNTTGQAGVAIATTLRKPYPGMRQTHTEALALDMVRTAAHLPGCTGIEYDAHMPDSEDQAPIELLKRMLDPEQFAHSVTDEVRNAVRRVLGIRGQQEGLAA